MSTNLIPKQWTGQELLKLKREINALCNQNRRSEAIELLKQEISMIHLKENSYTDLAQELIDIYIERERSSFLSWLWQIVSFRGLNSLAKIDKVTEIEMLSAQNLYNGLKHLGGTDSFSLEYFANVTFRTYLPPELGTDHAPRA